MYIDFENNVNQLVKQITDENGEYRIPADFAHDLEGVMDSYDQDLFHCARCMYRFVVHAEAILDAVRAYTRSIEDLREQEKKASDSDTVVSSYYYETVALNRVKVEALIEDKMWVLRREEVTDSKS